jgi:threonine synthase
MLYYSTNHTISKTPAKPVSFREALIQGLAPDEGLYMPMAIPELDASYIISLKNQPYHRLASSLLSYFVGDDVEVADLEAICEDAYNFDIPIEKWDNHRYIARLDQGATASFKDFAARWMARMMRFFKTPDQEITVLVATSGDTGSAVGQAFYGLEGVKVIILFPTEEVSPIQRHQLEAIGGNVQAVAVSGKFDDCQALVKQAFVDKDLKNIGLTSANSINVGRVLPQMVYYAYIYLKICNYPQEIMFSVPSGNLGNSLGCEIARRMGFPIRRLIIATNANRAFPEFLRTGKYEKINPSIPCLSNAMNVGNPSNLARYFELFGGNVDKNGEVHLQPDWVRMQDFMKGYNFTDAQTISMMLEMYHKYQILVEPHGAIGILGLEEYLRDFPDDKTLPIVSIETAHPAKFPEIIREHLHIEPYTHPQLEAMMTKEGSSILIPNDYEAFKSFLTS